MTTTAPRHDAHVRAYADLCAARADAELVENARRCILARCADHRMVAWAHDVISTDTAIAVDHAHDYCSTRIHSLPVSRIAHRRVAGIVFG